MDTRSFTITIHVDYTDDCDWPDPDDMDVQLRDNVERCMANAELLNDSDLLAVTETVHVHVFRHDDRDPKARDAAAWDYEHDDNVNVDDDARVSWADDGTAWVQAWLRVDPNE